MIASRGRMAVVTAAVIVSAGLVVAAAEPRLGIQLWARYWTIPPDFWQGKAAWQPPEKTALDRRHLSDLGVAFSGGGTRSAAATVGELRGLMTNGWLPHVRYVTAVSGGSWAAVPFTYSSSDLQLLLGKERAAKELSTAVIEELGGKGSLTRSIAESKLFAPGAREAARIIGQSELDKRKVPAQIQSLLQRYIAGRTSETYANILAKFFITPYIENGATRHYTWDDESFNDMKSADSGVPLGMKDFVEAAPNRPFLIVGGTVIYQHPAYDYPRLIPVEYTPMYTGIRQHYGDRLGGIYVAPFAYDAVAADSPDADRVRVTLRQGARPFTLADVIASSGAAPLLALQRGAPVAALKRATVAFPSFNHFSVRQTAEGLTAEPVVADLLHGDGGFSDNLGVMPLLARRVHNILVFVNGTEKFADNESIESMFWQLNKQEDFGGDRSMNGVFTASRYSELKDGIEAAVAKGGPAIYCGTNWEVLPNELYNIAGYEGLNICWIHNQRIDTWMNDLPADTRAMAASKGFKNFPWFSTFEQNKPYVIRLTPAQVNLLAHFTWWTITSQAGRAAIEKAMGDALK